MPGEGVGDDLDVPAVRIDAAGGIVAANEAATTVLSVPESPDGVSVESVFEAEAAEAVLSGLSESDPPESVRYDCEDGGWYEFSLYPAGDGLAAVGRQRSDDDLSRAELRTRATVLDALPVPVYHLDEHGRNQYLNPAYADLVGADLDTVLGLSVHLALRERDVERAQELLREMLSEDPTTGNSRTFEQVTFTVDGRRIPCENRVALLMDDEEFAGTAGVILDASDRKQERERIEVLERVLRHNLRTKVGLVEGYLQSVTPADPGSERHVEGALEATADLLSFSRKIRRIGGAIVARDNRRAVSVDRYVADAVEKVSERYPDVTFETDVEETAVLAGSAIEIVLEELLDNAAKHNDADDPTVRVESTSAKPNVSDDFEAYAEPAGVRIVDDGPGIPEQERTVVTGDDDVSPLKHSDGLGLWSAAWVVQAYDGTLRIEDADPTGTAVEVLLPPAE
jgi:PAS domain S-box-containing protein